MPDEQPTMATLIAHVKAHALAHYADGGWDVIVEAWDDEQIEEVLTEDHATTNDEAIASFANVVSVWKDRQDDARNSAF